MLYPSSPLIVMFNGIEILDHKKEKENVVCHIPTLVMEFGFSTLQDNIKERFKKKKSLLSVLLCILSPLSIKSACYPFNSHAIDLYKINHTADCFHFTKKIKL